MSKWVTLSTSFPSLLPILLSQEVHSLLLWAIKLVPPEFIGKRFFSNYILVLKKDEGWRPTVELRILNNCVLAYHFRMVTLATIVPSLDPGDWFMSLDVEDAYCHVAIHPCHKHFLRFVIGVDHYHYWVLPFGLSVAPRAFTMILSVVVTWFCQRGISALPYLDSWLLRGQSPKEVQSAMSRSLTLFQSLGPCISHKKSMLTSGHRIDFIEATLHSKQQGLTFPKRDSPPYPI